MKITTEEMMEGEECRKETALTRLLNAPQQISQTPVGTSHLGLTPISNSSLNWDRKPRIVIRNVVATVNLCNELDLISINCRTRNSQYDPAKFKGLFMRIRDPKTTALIFKSGKMNIMGAKSISAALLAARKYAAIIQKLGFSVKFSEFKVVNMVGTCDIRFPIQLEAFSQSTSHAQFCSYEPEIFPAVIYRMLRPRIVLLVFVNGRIVIIGAKLLQEMYDGLENIMPTLRKYRKE